MHQQMTESPFGEFFVSFADFFNEDQPLVSSLSREDTQWPFQSVPASSPTAFCTKSADFNTAYLS